MTSDSKAVRGGGDAEILKGLQEAIEGELADVLLEGGAFSPRQLARRLLNGPIAALASTAGAAAGDWQPISTAPADGRTIIAYGGRFDEPTPTQADGAWWNSAAGRSLRGSPTHWMPLPAAPGQSPAVPASPGSGAETASPPAPAEHGVEIRERIAEEVFVGNWIHNRWGEPVEPNVEARVAWRSGLPKGAHKIAYAIADAVLSALSQGGGAGRSEKGEGDSIERVRSSHAELIADGLARQDPAPHAAPPATGTWKTLTVSACPKNTAPCHWGGGNDIIWCSTCGAQYAYAKGEERPPCPRSAAPAQSPSTSDGEG